MSKGRQTRTKVQKATIDLFDESLGEAYGYHQALPPPVRFKLYRQEFSIDPQNWIDYRPPEWVFALNWREYRYADVRQLDDLKLLIPEDDPGIYIFYTRPDRLLHCVPQFPFYVGISNERGSNRPLRERLNDYVPTALSAIRKRKNIHRMLQMYYSQIWVVFALTSKPSSELKKIEEQIHGFVHPCFARRDFPTRIKNQQKAWGIT